MNQPKDYRDELRAVGWIMPETADDYRFRELAIIDPDEQCKEEYEDFIRLVNANKAKYSKIKGAERSYVRIVKSETEKYRSCDLVLHVEKGEVFASGDHLVHAWVRYLNSARKSNITDWSFVERCVGALPPGLFEVFLECMWSPGNFIFWKKGHCVKKCSNWEEARDMGKIKRPCPTINTAKAGRPVMDRPDYTFEAIRRWFENRDRAEGERLYVPEALDNVLSRENAELDKLFDSWDGFVDYHRLKGSFVTESLKVIDLKNTTPPVDTDSAWAKEMVITFSGDDDVFIPLYPGELSKNSRINSSTHEYECYLRNSICAIRNRSLEFGF